jgi:hypothetical protein
MKPNRLLPTTAFALLAMILLLCVLISCTAQRQLDPGTVNMIRCEYTFLNTEREDADRIAKVVERYRMEDFSFFIDVGDDSIYCEFTVAGVPDIDRMHKDLRHLPQLRQQRYADSNINTPAGSIIFDEIDPVMKMTYRAARLEAGFQMLARFRISPGARLYYAAEGDYEEEVGDIFIDKNGLVSLPIAVKENQNFVYGRTVLGKVVKCIRIYIYTGETEEISLDEYEQYVRMMPGMKPY